MDERRFIERQISYRGSLAFLGYKDLAFSLTFKTILNFSNPQNSVVLTSLEDKLINFEVNFVLLGS